MRANQEQPYYTLDISLFEGMFRYFGNEPVQVRGKIHLSEEAYRLQPAERAIEPIEHLAGRRHYVHLKPFVQVPDIVLTIGLYNQTTPTGTIGEVLESRERRHKEIEIGQAQAWYYPQDCTIILWECLLHTFVCDTSVLKDPNMCAFWQGFERFLQGHFERALRICTPYHDPEYEREEYQQFLHTLGYRPVAKAAFGKEIPRS